jgi:hypothetical protein
VPARADAVVRSIASETQLADGRDRNDDAPKSVA